MKRTASQKTALALIAVSGVFGFVGTSLGAFWLGAMWGIPVPFSLGRFFFQHPYLQIYGFVYLFIMGVSHTLIPRFKNKAVPQLASILVFSVFLAGLLLFFVSSFLAQIFLIVSAVMHAVIMVWVVGRPSGPLAASEYYFLAASFLLPVALLLKAVEEMFLASRFGFDMVQLSFLGFPVLMIFGVELRTLHFRGAKIRNSVSYGAFSFLSSGCVLSVLSFLVKSSVGSFAAAALFLVGGVLFAVALQVFVNPLAAVMSRMNERDRKRFDYFTACIRISFLWLLAGLVLGLVSAASLLWFSSWPFVLRDSVIHVFGVGFLGSTILGYGPILLPGILSSQAPYRGLTLWSLYILSVANVIRILGNGFLQWTSVFFWPAAISGPLVLASMVFFMIMIHRLRGEKTVESRLTQIQLGK